MNSRIEKRLVSKPLATIDLANLSALAETECRKHTWTFGNRVQARESVISALRLQRPDIHHSKIREVVKA